MATLEMNFTQSDLVDALPALDKQFDVPEAAHDVQMLLQAEMGAPITDVDAYLAQHCPQLWDSSRLSESVNRLERSKLISDNNGKKLSGAIKTLTSPSPDADLSQWEAAVNQAIIEVSKQENALLNATVAESCATGRWLHFNAFLEGTIKRLEAETANVTRSIHDAQRARQTIAERVFPHLMKWKTRDMEAIYRGQQCSTMTNQLLHTLSSRGFDYYKIQEAKRLAEASIDSLDPTINSTVREYETVRTTELNTTDEQNTRISGMKATLDTINSFENISEVPDKRPRL